MARRYKAVYFETDSNRIPVEEFIDSLGEFAVRQFFGKCELLESYGPALCEPHAKKIHKKEKIYELRFSGEKERIRVLYFFFDRKRIILTNGFVKKTQKTPPKEIKTAIKRKKIYFARKRSKVKKKKK